MHHMGWLGGVDMGGHFIELSKKNQSTVYNCFPLLYLMFNYELDSEVMRPRLCTRMSLV